MVLHVGTQEWAVHFFHTTEQQHGRKPKRLAFCTLHPVPCAKQARPCDTPGAAVAAASLYFKDDFSRRTGRRVALTRAIALLNLPIDTRRGLWDAYLIKTGIKKAPDQS